MPLPTIYFIRHGETDWNAAHRYQGHTDIPLNDTGRAQARRNGARLADLLAEEGLAADAVGYVASPLARAAETMRIVRAVLGLPSDGFTRDPRLMEANYGHWEGLTLTEIRARDPEGLARRTADPLGFAPEGGETYADVGARAFRCLGELTGPTVVVAHGGVSKVVRGAILKLSGQDAMVLPVPQDRIFRIRDGQVDAL